MGEIDILLDAIKKQRWYFFKNNDKIIFDRETGLIWTNLKNFQEKNNIELKSVKDFLNDINRKNWGGYNSWEIPTAEDFNKILRNKTFPYQNGENWRINNKFGWCIVDQEGIVRAIDLDYKPSYQTTLNKVWVLPCCRAIQPANFSSTSSNILDIFKKNKLIPEFKDAEANRIFKKLIEEKTTTPAKFDFNSSLKKYDAASIDKSPIKFIQRLQARLMTL